MKKVFALFLGICLLGCQSVLEENKAEIKPANLINDELMFQKIFENTFVVTDKVFFDSNILVAKMPDGSVVLASSPFETSNAQALIDWITKEMKPTKIVAINTHFHADGTGGNEAYVNAGAEVWANEMTAKWQQEKSEVMQKEIAENLVDKKLKERVLMRKNVVAQKIFESRKGLTLNFGGEEVVVHYPGPAHSIDNVVVFFPQRSVLFGGCMIREKGSKVLGYIGHADVKRWPESANNVLKFAPKIVVPGHGLVGGIDLIHETVALATRSHK